MEIPLFAGGAVWVGHLLWEQGVGGSNPLVPTSKERTCSLSHKSFLLLDSTVGSIWRRNLPITAIIYGAVIGHVKLLPSYL